MVNVFKRLTKSLRLISLKKSEDFFLKQINDEKIPVHVAIIMDGNGRWAKARRLPRIAGHRAGTKVVHQIVEVAAELDVKYLTLYAFSVENWQRPKSEVSALMGLFDKMLAKEIKELHESNVKFIAIGRLNELSQRLQKTIEKAMRLTEKNTGLILNIAINYSGRVEIIDCVKQIAKKVDRKELEPDKINEETIINNLYVPGAPDPELLIRTGGERRVSNFLLWQIAYSEFWITPVLWPDFKKINFLKAIYEFQLRERRFGGLQ
ncbi:isoprenyl transferase [Candidatus Oleimmundimicrobium sp.]|uniref:isoprenyl transferase n=1 Tax=Candidatus Oleimmundimicrobium sp. TaxID=3060597 RepID=UPI00271FB656|nr:isoprenyl transferase [Candidatus Oleimmundimicrobium sp.]MDO8886485.1 isoprenyl transferase [Candidatus Oleimmundimicrobium sp.]